MNRANIGQTNPVHPDQSDPLVSVQIAPLSPGFTWAKCGSNLLMTSTGGIDIIRPDILKKRDSKAKQKQRTRRGGWKRMRARGPLCGAFRRMVCSISFAMCGGGAFGCVRGLLLFTRKKKTLHFSLLSLKFNFGPIDIIFFIMWPMEA